MNPITNSCIRCVVAFSLVPALTMAGPKWTYNEGNSSMEIAPTIQTWGAYTLDPKNEPAVDPRADLFLRRLHLTMRGQAMPSIGYQAIFAFDNTGKDPLGGPAPGSSQDLNNSRIIMQEAWVSWTADTNVMVATAGLLRPQTSREFISPYAQVSSLDFSLVYNYVRQHLSTRSTGRESGMDLGGQWATPMGMGMAWHLGGYDVTPELAKQNANLRGHRIWSPLLTGRLELIMGDMENPKQILRKGVQYFGKRNGATLGAWASHQGTTSQLFDSTATKFVYAGGFESNDGMGLDLLLNLGGLALNGESVWLSRKAARTPTAVAQKYTDLVWMTRASYALPLAKTGWIIEPNATYSSFKGDSLSLQNAGKEDVQTDLGINLFPPTKGIRVSTHLVIPTSQTGKSPKNTTLVGEILLAL